MLKKLVSVVLLAAMMALPAVAATTGDPIDGNDRTLGSVEQDCGMALLYPSCGWCVTNCIYAIIAEAWAGSGVNDWTWNIR